MFLVCLYYTDNSTLIWTSVSVEPCWGTAACLHTDMVPVFIVSSLNLTHSCAQKSQMSSWGTVKAAYLLLLLYPVKNTCGQFEIQQITWTSFTHFRSWLAEILKWPMKIISQNNYLWLKCLNISDIYKWGSATVNHHVWQIRNKNHIPVY